MRTFEVQAQACTTCIYRPDSVLDLVELEAEIADPHMAGYFQSYRICHSTPRGSQVCCAGFWHRHREHFTVGQVAQRVNAVSYVSVKDRSIRVECKPPEA